VWAGVAGSISAVYSRHIVLASRTFRETNFVISLPIPRQHQLNILLAVFWLL
jgi:hypothetical protein